MRKRALFFYPISKDRTLNKKRVPSFKGTLSWGTWIRTKIPSSRGTCTAVVRFPNESSGQYFITHTVMRQGNLEDESGL